MSLVDPKSLVNDIVRNGYMLVVDKLDGIAKCDMLTNCIVIEQIE